MADYSRAKAKKKEKKSLEFDDSLSKSEKNKIKNKVKKSPLLIICLIFLVLSAVGGYFAFSYLSAFEMNEYKINGEISAESDYVVVDMSSIKEQLAKTDNEVTIEELYASVALEDKGVTCKIFGVDISNSVTVKYFYREDMSHDEIEVSGINISVPGIYYIQYTSSNFLYKNTTLIRTVIVTGVEIDG